MILKKAASKELLNLIYRNALNSKNWNFLYPRNNEEKHAKINVYSIEEQHDVKDKFLLGLCTSLLLEVYKNGGKDYFNNNFPSYIGISMKDQFRSDNLHTDEDPHYKKNIKILGLLNPEWKKEWGGGFVHGEKIYSIEPGDFVVFDSTVLHKAEDITINKKRIALDFSLDGI